MNVIDSNVIPTSSHNLSFIKNCVAVSAVSISLGVELQDLRSRIQTFSAPKGRCFVKQIKDITIIDDTYNANLTSSLAALDYLSAFSGDGRKIFVFGGYINEKDFHMEDFKVKVDGTEEASGNLSLI